jgi:putative chitinase
MSLTQAVGRNAPNLNDDVAVVQALLNLNEHLLHGLPLLTVDGSFGPRTQDTIEEFQRLVATPGSATGVIKPGSATLDVLLAPVDGVLTPRVLQVLMPLSTLELAERYCAPLVATMAAAQIDTPLRKAHFLAQLGHESGSLKFSSEIASGQKYEGRRDLGNTEPGDGPRFKGRGLIQITGRANYTAYGKARGRDFVTGNNPLLLATDPELAADCSGWFWTTRKLNPLADADDVERITKRINGGRNGLPDRIRRLRIAKTVLVPPAR